MELLTGLIHHINAHAERRVEKELIGSLAPVQGKKGIYTKRWPGRLGCRRHGCIRSWLALTWTRWATRSPASGSSNWPAPEDPDAGEDVELDGRAEIADRIADGVSWLWRCAGWLAQIDTGQYPLAVNLQPADEWPDTAHVAVDLARVHAVLGHVAADLDKLARTRRVADLNTAATSHPPTPTTPSSRADQPSVQQTARPLASMSSGPLRRSAAGGHGRQYDL